PVASDAADSPYGTAVVIVRRSCSPCCHAGRIVYRDAYKPAMKRTAVPHAPVTNIKNVAHDAECRSLLLNGWIKVYAVVCSCRLNVHGPAGIEVAAATFRERMRCFLVVPPSGVIIASKKSAREPRSTMGVPVMPTGSSLVQMRSSADTGSPTFRCQITV